MLNEAAGEYKLTEFQPIEQIESANENLTDQKSIIGFLGRLFRKKDDDSTFAKAQLSNEVDLAKNEAEHETQRQLTVTAVSSQIKPANISNSTKKTDPFIRRKRSRVSQSSMTRRINAVLNPSIDDQNLMDYNRSDFRQYWMPDCHGKECYECQEKFNTFRRRHHCRICGQIFCSQCCNQAMPGRFLGYTGELRLCRYCCRAVVQYLDSPDSVDATLQSAQDFSQLKEELCKSLSESAKFRSAVSATKYSSSVQPLQLLEVGPDEETDGTFWQSDVQLHKQVISSPSIGSISSLDRLSSNVSPIFSKDYLIINNYGSAKSASLQSLDSFIPSDPPAQTFDELENEVEPDWVRNIDIHHDHFGTSTSYIKQPLENEAKLPLSQQSKIQIAKRDEINFDGQGSLSLFYSLDISNSLNRTVDNSMNSQLSLTLNSDCSSVFASSVADLNLQPNDPSETDNGEIGGVTDLTSLSSERSQHTTSCIVEGDGLNQILEHHAKQLLHYLIRRSSMPSDGSWFNVLWPLAKKIAFTVQPNVRSRKDDMDIRSYVHVKTVVNQNIRTPSADVVFGTVCSKAICDTRMRSNILKPKILIIGGSLEYERVTGKFCSLDPVLNQESDYLRAAVSKIFACQPDLLIVEKSVSRVALDYLRDVKITLVCNVKLSVLKRIARCTNADVISSVDALIAKPKLGQCGLFRTENIDANNHDSIKSIMYFEDCQPDLNCAVILHDCKKSTLIDGKKVLKYIISALYSNKLEAELLNLYHASSEKAFFGHGAPGNHCAICQNCNNLFASANFEHVVSMQTDHHVCLAKALHATPLVASPFILFCLPYLETASGKICKLKDYFRGILFPFDTNSIAVTNDEFSDDIRSDEIVSGIDCIAQNSVNSNEHPDNNLKPSAKVCHHQHPFIFEKLTKPASHATVKSCLAQYRAYSAKIFRDKIESPIVKIKRLPKQSQKSISVPIDVLNPYLHQRIAVLFCSYSESSANSPGFCINPWVVVMEFYGRNDISLGDFLVRYCFNPDYSCPSTTCDARMLYHTRKVVHNNACVTISLQKVIDSPDDPGATSQQVGTLNTHDQKSNGDEILVWNWCGECKSSSESQSLNQFVWHLSFAKYLDYLCNGHRLTSTTLAGPCSECLFHQQCHYFAKHETAVSIKVHPIQLHDIAFPSSSVTISPRFMSVLDILESTKKISEQSGTNFTAMFEQVYGIRNLTDSKRHEQTLFELTSVYEQAQEAIRLQVSMIQETLVPFANKDLISFLDAGYIQIVACMLRCHQIIQNSVLDWNKLAAEFLASIKRQKVSANDDGPSKESKNSSSSLVSLTTSSKLHESPAADIQDSEIAANLSADDFSSPLEDALIKSSLVEGISHETVLSENATAITDLPVPTFLTISSTAPAANASCGETRKSLSAIPPSKLISILPIPFKLSEHYLPFGSIPVCIIEEEISSIIAYALSSKEYIEQMRESRKKFLEQDIAISLKYSNILNEKIQAENAVASALSNTATSDESNKFQHIELQFSDTVAKFYCKIYFAEHFRLLRKLIFPQGEDAFIRSLSSCFSWKPQGGKSGACFYKTRDDRFVMKQMSRFEIQSFLSFAGNYFHYIATACTENKLTALSKILGVYLIGLRNQQTGVAEKLHVLVMENLFYGRDVGQVFDLKGSMRNRLVSEKRSADLVLLDENLMKKACVNPFYIYPHSKTALNIAVTNDSHFLSSNLIMDYSLLAGIDEQKKEFVIGIIDYIRTYTWDKRLETWVKSVSVHGSLPTVISPELYCTRFCEAMDLYFLVAPDQWAGLGHGISY